MMVFKRNGSRKAATLLLLFTWLFFTGCRETPAPEKQNEAEVEWYVKDSFTMQPDSEGYSLPTSIAFVPKPGSGTKDPLYFVTELRGRIRVVSNDRTVHTFTENPFNLTAAEELPLESGEFGMAGLCLDSKHGYVFATFAYQDSNGVLYNNISRFSTQPESFALKPAGVISFTDVFSSYESGVSHQIGNCRVVGDHLYVGVGDGQQSFNSQRKDSILGKILRMTLDGKPVPENPFYVDDDIHNSRNYIYALGLRNPFAIVALEDRILVADNGLRLDRFLEIQRGEDYHWSGGSDRGIAAVSNGVISPSVGPVQLDYYAPEKLLFPDEYKGSFFLAASGADSGRGPGKGVLHLKFDTGKQRMTAPPEYIVQYRGNDFQAVTGVALGPDALYFVPLYPLSNGKSVIMKIVHTPGKVYQTDLELNPGVLIGQKGCLECHSFGDTRGKVGPSLGRDELLPRIKARLNSEEYRKSVLELDRIEKEPYKSYSKARQQVLESKDLEQVRLWVKYHLMEPRFDNPKSRMPNMSLTEEQAVRLAEYLIKPPPKKGLLMQAESFLQVVFWKWQYKSLTNFVAGFVSAILLVCVLAFYYFRKKRTP